MELPLLKPAMPYAAVIGPWVQPTEFDLHAPLLSLPLACGTTLAKVPAAERGYLAPPQETLQRWAARQIGRAHV